MDNLEDPITVCYKRLDDSTPLDCDVYLPRTTAPPREREIVTESDPQVIPIVIYFHAGGLSVGNKEWFPTWLYRRVRSLGYAFVSANYQLMPPASAHDIIADMQDLFSFITQNEIQGTQQTFKGNPNMVAVAGSSAGGLCAQLAAMHCSPKPKVIVSLYAMGGNLFTPHYLKAKNEVFFMGRDLLNRDDFPDYLYPFKRGAPSRTSDSPLVYHPVTGDPANRRIYLPRLYLQLGCFIDYYTGMHDPSLSNTLGAILEDDFITETELEYRDKFERAIPEAHRLLFPQLGVDSSWPPTILLHGTGDTAIPVDDSRHMQAVIERAGIPVELIEFEGMEHLFDFAPDAEEIWGEKFDRAKDFLRKWLDTPDP
ncbi:Alpha/Beta hydrolase protein [Flammula alnicola]|nr:Alpha/Beta hydrolase protein [Flammula alnicola]